MVKAINTNKKLLAFDLVRGSDTYDEVKNSCMVYENNQKRHASSLNNTNDEEKTEMELEVEKVRKQVEEMRLMPVKATALRDTYERYNKVYLLCQVWPH